MFFFQHSIYFLLLLVVRPLLVDRHIWKRVSFLSYNKTKKSTNVKIILFLHTICHNSDMFRSLSIIFRGLLNISNVYVITWIIKHVKICA